MQSSIASSERELDGRSSITLNPPAKRLLPKHMTHSKDAVRDAVLYPEQDHKQGERHLISALESMSLLQLISQNSLKSLTSLPEQLSASDAVMNSIAKSGHSPVSGGLLNHVSRSLAEEWISEAQLLCQILSNPHLVNLIRICDTIIQDEVRKETASRPHHEYCSIRSCSRHSSRTKSRTSADRDQNPIYQSIDSHLTTCHNHEYDVLDDHGFECDRSTPKTYENKSYGNRSRQSKSYESKYSVKLVQIIKGGEPLGITVQLVEENGPVVVSRILYGGSIHRSGLVSVGDFIYEVNGIPLKGRRHRDIIRLLEQESHRESISFKLLVPDMIPKMNHHYSNNNIVCKSDLRESGIFLKCHFDYNPCFDAQHPCPNVGLVFRKGDILEIVSQDDDYWWQARNEQDMYYMSRAGVIPSARLQEKRLAALRDITRQRYLSQKVELCLGFKSPIRKAMWSHKVRKVMYNVSENEDFEENDLPTYEEVIHLYPTIGFCRPIVLFGSHLIGQKKLIRRLKNIDPDSFRTPIAHTTRPARDWELDGAEYLFVTKDWFLQEEKAGNFIESEEYREHLYGIHRETVRSIIASGSVCLLSLQSQGLKAVRNPLFKPFVIFLKPDPQSLAQSVERLVNEYEYDDHNAWNDVLASSKTGRVKQNHFKSMSDDEKNCLLHDSSKLEYLYGHYFDVIVVVSNNMDDVISQLVQTIRLVQLVPQWAPASWL
jgi:guanylate kinase